MKIEGQYQQNYSDPLVETTVADLHMKLGSNSCNLFVRKSIEGTLYDVCDIVMAGYAACGIETEFRTYNSATIIIKDKSDLTFTVIRDRDYGNDNPWEKTHRDITINGFGVRKLIEKLNSYLREKLITSKLPTVRWEYMEGTSRKAQYITIQRAKPIYNEFYPWIGDVEAYFERYMASESSVLVLLGEAGTAKTSFIRSMIWRYSLDTVFTYDEDLLTSDAMFAEFITGRMNLLIVEDADLFLMNREHDGNKVMSKFLNISDGLASNDRKKIIFSANILNPENIDSALLRPGRCFDCLRFRKLTYEESCRAAEVSGIEAPESGSHSLAELFAKSKGENTFVPRKSLGF